MQFGIFTVGDVTPDPTTGRTPTEHERLKAMVAIALKAEEVVPVLREEFAKDRPAEVPDAPTRASLSAAREQTDAVAG